jgi:hypothetical protein
MYRFSLMYIALHLTVLKVKLSYKLKLSVKNPRARALVPHHYLEATDLHQTTPGYSQGSLEPRAPSVFTRGPIL